MTFERREKTRTSSFLERFETLVYGLRGDGTQSLGRVVTVVTEGCREQGVNDRSRKEARIKKKTTTVKKKRLSS